MDNVEEMNKFLEIYNLPRLNQGKVENLNRLITSSEIESVNKNRNKNNKKQTNKKPPSKQKSRTSQLYREILPNIKRRANTCPSQTIPKN